MKTAVLFYTMGGTTKKEAERLAVELSADIFEVAEVKKRNIFSALLTGCPKALNRKPSEIKPVACDFNAYDKFILCAPVWAGFPAPAFNSMLKLILEGKAVDVVMCSSGGETPKSKEDTIALVKDMGFAFGSYTDVKTLSENPQNAK